jgi:hypothetical protein
VGSAWTFWAFLSVAPAADLQDLGFIAGHWRGEAGGTQIEETWNAPEQGSVTGMYREMQGGKTTFYELLFESNDPSNPLMTYSRTSKSTMDMLLERKRDGHWVKQVYQYTRAK